MTGYLLFNAELVDNGFHRGLDAASIQGRLCQMGFFQSSLAIGENEIRMPVQFPKNSQHEERVIS